MMDMDLTQILSKATKLDLHFGNIGMHSDGSVGGHSRWLEVGFYTNLTDNIMIMLDFRFSVSPLEGISIYTKVSGISDGTNTVSVRGASPAWPSKQSWESHTNDTETIAKALSKIPEELLTSFDDKAHDKLEYICGWNDSVATINDLVSSSVRVAFMSMKIGDSITVDNFHIILTKMFARDIIGLQVTLLGIGYRLNPYNPRSYAIQAMVSDKLVIISRGFMGLELNEVESLVLNAYNEHMSIF